MLLLIWNFLKHLGSRILVNNSVQYLSCIYALLISWLPSSFFKSKGLSALRQIFFFVMNSLQHYLPGTLYSSTNYEGLTWINYTVFSTKVRLWFIMYILFSYAYFSSLKCLIWISIHVDSTQVCGSLVLISWALYRYTHLNISVGTHYKSVFINYI